HFEGVGQDTRAYAAFKLTGSGCASTSATAGGRTGDGEIAAEHFGEDLCSRGAFEQNWSAVIFALRGFGESRYVLSEGGDAAPHFGFARQAVGGDGMEGDGIADGHAVGSLSGGAGANKRGGLGLADLTAFGVDQGEAAFAGFKFHATGPDLGMFVKDG